MLPPVGLDLLKALVGWSLDADGDSLRMLKRFFLKCFLLLLEIIDFYW